MHKKIIIDTNLWISFLLTRQWIFLDGLLEQGRYKLVFCKRLWDEFLDVSQRPELAKYFNWSDIEDLVQIMDKYAIMYEIISDIDLCRDKKDNFLLSLAVDSNANYLITGDNDLLVLKEIGKTKIISINEFKSIVTF